MKEAKVDALEALKKVLQNCGTEFTVLSEAHKLGNDDINRGT